MQLGIHQKEVEELPVCQRWSWRNKPHRSEASSHLTCPHSHSSRAPSSPLFSVSIQRYFFVLNHTPSQKISKNYYNGIIARLAKEKCEKSIEIRKDKINK